jgi:ectoine hydroxylase-related dioxygenase (phytanoyl-CoA dioxygenase family)
MYASTRKSLHQSGFAVLPQFISASENAELSLVLKRPESSSAVNRAAFPVYAIRNLLQEVPELAAILAGTKLMEVVHEVFGPDYFNVKGIYFDKPADFNWNVAWHQDLSISVDQRQDSLPGFVQWSMKEGQVAVRPPLSYSKNIRTLRIHLDACDEANGALRVLPGTHLEGILRYDDTFSDREVVTCSVPECGAMLMSPLLMHSSHRSSGGRRRVIHLEFSNMELPKDIEWREKADLTKNPVPKPNLYI